jgi:hypothetical protein
MSVWAPDGSRRRNAEDAALREAVKLLRGVGGPSEWWWWSPSLIGHLRVPLTAGEYEQCPAGCAVADAGECGPRRDRTP